MEKHEAYAPRDKRKYDRTGRDAKRFAVHDNQKEIIHSVENVIRMFPAKMAARLLVKAFYKSVEPFFKPIPKSRRKTK
jgi:hypothetical protein